MKSKVLPDGSVFIEPDSGPDLSFDPDGQGGIVLTFRQNGHPLSGMTLTFTVSAMRGLLHASREALKAVPIFGLALRDGINVRPDGSGGITWQFHRPRETAIHGLTWVFPRLAGEALCRVMATAVGEG
jgi:hypothetical protein